MEFSIKIQTQITILKLIKLEQKKKKRKKEKEEEQSWWEEKKGTHLTHLCVRESFLNALE